MFWFLISYFYDEILDIFYQLHNRHNNINYSNTTVVEDNLSEEHYHKSFILTIGGLTVMDFQDNQPQLYL